jgi:preprotein translocase subunit SecF
MGHKEVEHMIEIIRDTKIDFMSYRKFAFIFSAILSVLGIAALVQIGTGKANLGVDFAGGTAVQIKFHSTVPLNEIRAALEKGGLKDFDLQDLPTENKILIRVKKQEEKIGGYAETITQVMNQSFKDKGPVIDSVTEIGPKVGSRLRSDALMAIVVSVICLLIYVGWRFQFRFGVGATVATFHDVLAVLGIFYILDKEINLILLSALLTVAGYSLTDTVIIFDRIRENMKKMIRETMTEVVNKSLNEVLSRTIVTTLTTLLAALALFFFGGEVLHDFSLAIIVGLIIGTYSSMFIASPVVLMMGSKTTIMKKK